MQVITKRMTINTHLQVGTTSMSKTTVTQFRCWNIEFCCHFNFVLLLPCNSRFLSSPATATPVTVTASATATAAAVAATCVTSCDPSHYLTVTFCVADPEVAQHSLVQTIASIEQLLLVESKFIATGYCESERAKVFSVCIDHHVYR